MDALGGFTVAVDVQHLFRDGMHANDRGTRFALEAGGRVWEADCALHYAQAMCAALRAHGATVLTNEPKSGVLVGPYSRRQVAADAAHANLYLACHLNAGHGRYALAEYASRGQHAMESQALAKAIVADLSARFPGVITSGQVRSLDDSDRGWVCVSSFTNGPALLLEPIFGDNPEHQALMSLEGLTALGGALAEAVTAAVVASRVA